jgi:hypothetical protein
VLFLYLVFCNVHWCCVLCVCVCACVRVLLGYRKWAQHSYLHQTSLGHLAWTLVFAALWFGSLVFCHIIWISSEMQKSISWTENAVSNNFFITFCKLCVIAKNVTLLCCRYFSLQATCSLGCSDKIRFYVEHNICREEGPLPDCFRKPVDIVFNALEKVIIHVWAGSVSLWYLPRLVLQGAYGAHRNVILIFGQSSQPLVISTESITCSRWMTHIKILIYLYINSSFLTQIPFSIMLQYW